MWSPFTTTDSIGAGVLVISGAGVGDTASTRSSTMSTWVGLPRVMTSYVVVFVNSIWPRSLIVALTAYVARSSIEEASYSISKLTGTWPGLVIVTLATVTEGASCSDTSRSSTSTVASGPRAIRSR